MKVINIIENKLNKKAKIEFLPMQPGDVVESSAVIHKSIKMLDYKPKTNITKGISNIIDWYLNYYH